MERVENIIKVDNIKYVQVECEDLNGVSRGLTLDVKFFLKHISLGIPCPKAACAFTAYGDLTPVSSMLEEIDYCNGYLYPDLDTFKSLPWKKNTASVLVNFLVEPLDPKSPHFFGSSRAICKKQLERLSAKGLKFYGALECEFYLMDKESREPLFRDNNFFVTANEEQAVGSSTRCNGQYECD